jgi:hypothetical protein
VRDNRQTATFRYRRSMLRAIEELTALTGGTTRENTVHLLLLDGLAAAYTRLRITDEPAAMAGRLLEAIGASWEADLTGEELAAFEVTRKALARIAEIKARENAGEAP